MAGNRMICTTNNVDYSTIRKAMCEGARTVEELVEKTGVCTTCEGCESTSLREFFLLYAAAGKCHLKL